MIFRLLLLSGALHAPRILHIATAAAQGTIVTNSGYPGGSLNVSQYDFRDPVDMTTVSGNIVGLLLSTIMAVCFAVFSIGAFLFILGPVFGKSDWQSNGKGMMIAALIGVAIVVGARGILALVTYFIYFTPAAPPAVGGAAGGAGGAGAAGGAGGT